MQITQLTSLNKLRLLGNEIKRFPPEILTNGNAKVIFAFIRSQLYMISQHYLKPSRKKVLFIWSAVEKWLNRHNNTGEHKSITEIETLNDAELKKKRSIQVAGCRINI